MCVCGGGGGGGLKRMCDLSVDQISTIFYKGGGGGGGGGDIILLVCFSTVGIT